MGSFRARVAHVVGIHQTRRDIRKQGAAGRVIATYVNGSRPVRSDMLSDQVDKHFRKQLQVYKKKWAERGLDTEQLDRMFSTVHSGTRREFHFGQYITNMVKKLITPMARGLPSDAAEDIRAGVLATLLSRKAKGDIFDKYNPKKNVPFLAFFIRIVVPNAVKTEIRRFKKDFMTERLTEDPEEEGYSLDQIKVHQIDDLIEYKDLVADLRKYVSKQPGGDFLLGVFDQLVFQEATSANEIALNLGMGDPTPGVRKKVYKAEAQIRRILVDYGRKHGIPELAALGKKLKIK